MILNIRDRRKKELRWQHITAITEATYHDNSRADSDQAERNTKVIGYDEWPDVSLSRAIELADGLPYDATLYLYDLGDGIRTVTEAEMTERTTRPPAPDAVEVLRKIEWACGDEDMCPACWAEKREGHADNCELIAVLSAVP